MLPPPCLTVGFRHWGLYSSFELSHTLWWLSYPNLLNLDSSDRRTDFQKLIDLSTCSVENFRRLRSFCVWMASKKPSPRSFSLFFIVCVQTWILVASLTLFVMCSKQVLFFHSKLFDVPVCPWPGPSFSPSLQSSDFTSRLEFLNDLVHGS